MATILKTWADRSSRSLYGEYLDMLLSWLEFRLPSLHGRADRIETACKSMGAALNMTDNQLFCLSLAARFHDIGLLILPDSLLNKTGPMNPADQTLFSQHAALGGRMVAKFFPDFPDAIEGIWFHHERPDGKGPYRLKYGEIPMIASIIAVVDAVESLANSRPYGKTRKLNEIVEEIHSLVGIQFDKSVVDALKECDFEVYMAVVSNSQETPDSTPNPKIENIDTNKALTSLQVTGGKSVSGLSPVITKGELHKLIRDGLDLKPLAPTVCNVMATTQSPNCSAEDVAKQISLDQALSIRLLKLANSSAYWRGKRVDNIKSAVSRIGTQNIRSLVMALGVLNHYEGPEGKPVDVRFFWEHSIGCGLIASAIGKACNSEHTDEFFLWGLIHDVGRLILLDHVPHHYVKIWDIIDEFDIPPELAEQKILTIDHCEILQLAMQHWRFGREFIAPVVNHHRSASYIKSYIPDCAHSAAVIALSNRLCQAILLGCSGNDFLYPLDDLVELTKIPTDLLNQIALSVPDETNALKYIMLARSDSEIWPDFSQDVKNKLEHDFRPLCVSLQPQQDTYRIFCNSIASSPDDGPANLGVIYLRDPKDWTSLTNAFEAQEKNLNVSNLPVIVVYDKTKITSSDPWLQTRRHAILKTPVRIPNFINNINQLIIKR
ncbi:MAG: HDOD domain-containing protein [Phycisphaerae bacterium]